MSLGTIIGVIVGLALFLVNVFFGSAPASAFWDFNSVLTVFGGTIAATFIAYNERYVISAFKAIGSIFVKTKVDQKILFADVEKIIGWGEIMNKGGLQELQDSLTMLGVETDPFGNMVMGKDYPFRGSPFQAIPGVLTDKGREMWQTAARQPAPVTMDEPDPYTADPRFDPQVPAAQDMQTASLFGPTLNPGLNLDVRRRNNANATS